MKRNFLLIASSLFLAGIVAGQHDPVPTRIETAPYGMSDGMSIELQLDCYLEDLRPCIRLSGGDAGKAAFLLFSAVPADYRLPWGDIMRVKPSDLVVPGVFDGDGIFEAPFDVANDAFCGYTVYVQGAQVGIDLDKVELSHGLEMTFHEGTVQPDGINYTGPPATAVLCKARDWVAPPTYGVRVTVDQPYPGWDLQLEHIAVNGDVTEVYMNLAYIRDAAPLITDVLLTDRREVSAWVDIGEFVKPHVAIFVGRPPYTDIPKDYAFTAWIDATFPVYPSER